MYNDKLEILPKISKDSEKEGEGICCILDDLYYLEEESIDSEEKAKLKEEMLSFLKNKGWYSGSEIFPIGSGNKEDASDIYGYRKPLG